MEGEICKFQKFGFCKFKGGCKRKHLTQICESILRCKDINQGEKDTHRIERILLQEMVANMLTNVLITIMLQSMLRIRMNSKRKWYIGEEDC